MPAHVQLHLLFVEVVLELAALSALTLREAQ